MFDYFATDSSPAMLPFAWRVNAKKAPLPWAVLAFGFAATNDFK